VPGTLKKVGRQHSENEPSSK
jgi:hypothetical protein